MFLSSLAHCVVRAEQKPEWINGFCIPFCLCSYWGSNPGPTAWPTVAPLTVPWKLCILLLIFALFCKKRTYTAASVFVSVSSRYFGRIFPGRRRELFRSQNSADKVSYENRSWNTRIRQKWAPVRHIATKTLLTKEKVFKSRFRQTCQNTAIFFGATDVNQMEIVGTVSWKFFFLSNLKSF